MKNVAIIISHPPHGQAKGREALDIVLSLSDINHISLIFVNEGVLHLLPHQQTDKILMRDYISTFNMLELYDIDDVYVCHDSLENFNLLKSSFSIKANVIEQADFITLINKQDAILHF